MPGAAPRKRKIQSQILTQRRGDRRETQRGINYFSLALRLCNFATLR